MTRVGALAQRIRDLSRTELAEFRTWFERYDAERWDAQIEADARDGKLDSLAAKALEAHRQQRHPG
ncbi:MAG: hypothetical protein AAF560_30480 [Acidobacteriota bacterium]